MAVPKNHDPNVIAICSECKTQASAEYLYNSPFGEDAPCKACGGVLVITYKQEAKRVLDSMDKRRGLGPNSDD